jgi:preprotein translocase subunit SecD
MIKKNLPSIITIVLLFVLSMLILLPIDDGVLLNRDMLLGLDLEGGLHIVFEADLSQVDSDSEDEIIAGVVAVISQRINPLGVAEPLIERQGDNRIVVELPGVNLTEIQKDRIGRTALLEFREYVVDAEGNGEWIPSTGLIDGEEKAINSSYFIDNTLVTADDFGNILLVFDWNEEGSILSEQITSRLIGQQWGIFEGDNPLLAEDGHAIAPVIQGVIRDSGQISGLPLNDATELSRQLNAGRLPVELEIVYEQTVSPTLGADFVGLSVTAGVVGILIVMLFMLAFYRLPGLVAALALTFYGVLVLTIFKVIPVTLTLAGIGGFILSIGMAVDANVLIFERIKEELRAGRTLGAAIEAGFNRAWTAIRDSNMTTFIVCAILFWVGSSIASGAPVKGFAVTLFIGVAVSMFTAITVTRTLLRLFVSSRFATKKKYFTTIASDDKNA